jgi:hypothetical protein
MSSTFNTGDVNFFKTPEFDPVAMLLSKKRREQDKTDALNSFLPPAGTDVNEWPENDLKELEEFCRQHGIIAFNPGRMGPRAALRMLKGRMGIQEQPKPTQKTILLG